MTGQAGSLAAFAGTDVAGERARKAACVLAMLPPDTTAAILGASSPDQRRLFAQALLDVDGAAPDLVEAATIEFIAEVERINEEALGGINALRERFRTEAPGEEPAADVAPPMPELFGAMTVDEIAAYLSEQRSIIVAALLQALNAEMSSDILSRLPTAFANRILADLVRAPALDSGRRAALFDAIVADLAARIAGPKEIGEGLAAVEALMPLIDAVRRDEALRHLAAENHEAVQRLRQSLILFEDIPTRLPESAAARIIAEIDKATLLAVLARAERAAPATAAYLLGAMSKRMREQIAEERDASAAPGDADEIAAERRLMAVIRRLISEGQIAPLPNRQGAGASP